MERCISAIARVLGILGHWLKRRDFCMKFEWDQWQSVSCGAIQEYVSLPFTPSRDWKCLLNDQTRPTIFSKWSVHVQVYGRKSLQLLDLEESGTWGLVIVINGSIFEILHPNLYWKSGEMRMGPFLALKESWYQRVNFSQAARYGCCIHPDSR